MNLGDVGINDGGGAAIERDGAAKAGVRSAVHVHAIEDQSVRHLAERVLQRGTVAELDERVAERDGASQGELDSHEPEVMSRWICQHSSSGILRDDLRQ